MLTLEAKVLNVFSTKPFSDTTTGVITPAGHKVQLMYEMPAGVDGTEKRIHLDDFNVREQGAVYQKAVGKTVRVPVGVFLKEGGGFQFYIPKGGLPVVVGA